jgi:NAD(P)-dependent dehydrogenase (short-subunit alcohol dehydrogenase family)
VTWTPSRLPTARGRTFVVTGGNAGLGYFTAEQLASTGAHVVLASRSLERADAARQRIRENVPAASLDALQLDLADFASIRQAGEALAEYGRLDGLVLNAGITSGPRWREITRDGHELTVGTNYVGHFLLTALAWPALVRTGGSRVVGLGSMVTRQVPLDADDLQSERKYSFWRAYGFSKHMMQAFMFELDRRSRVASRDVLAVAAQPGLSLDTLSKRREGINEVNPAMQVLLTPMAAVSQGKNRGAAPTVRAALDPTLTGGEYVGPRYLLKGRPVVQEPVASSASPEFGQRLWSLSEEWTGQRFEV